MSPENPGRTGPNNSLLENKTWTNWSIYLVRPQNYLKLNHENWSGDNTIYIWGYHAQRWGQILSKSPTLFCLDLKLINKTNPFDLPALKKRSNFDCPM